MRLAYFLPILLAVPATTSAREGVTCLVASGGSFRASPHGVAG